MIHNELRAQAVYPLALSWLCCSLSVKTELKDSLYKLCLQVVLHLVAATLLIHRKVLHRRCAVPQYCVYCFRFSGDSFIYLSFMLFDWEQFDISSCADRLKLNPRILSIPRITDESWVVFFNRSPYFLNSRAIIFFCERFPLKH